MRRALQPPRSGEAPLGGSPARPGCHSMCPSTPRASGDELSIMPACAHTFHAACVARWLKDKPSCPVCMRDCRQASKSK